MGVFMLGVPSEMSVDTNDTLRAYEPILCAGTGRTRGALLGI